MQKEQALRLYVVLSRAFQTISEMDKQRIRKYGLSQSEFGVLELLFHKGAQPIQQLARKILLSSGSITYVVSQLEKKGLILRTQNETDRRIFYAELTKEGAALIESIFPAHEAFIHNMMNVLTEEEAESIIENLRRLGTSINAETKGAVN